MIKINELEIKYLIKQIKKGKLEFLNEWIIERKGKLYKIAWSYLYNHEDIEDVFQDTILKVYENIKKLHKKKYFETWFIRILINECKMKLRKRKKEVLKAEITYEKKHEDNYNFYEEINKLEDKFREAIVLKYISQYTQEEISEILDIPIGTVKSRIYRGLKELRKLMQEV
ncbi:MAG: RNA polymerase sigma factor [Senegalia sp. (in: firmicutes)]|uniref:RNA polymerase sigma factor n=1 Tax=Senegalia sp. (in: firmicutes) TaxID=1924098 RepID=UPI003F9A949E